MPKTVPVASHTIFSRISCESLCLCGVFLFLAPQAYAMHIADGILPLGWALLWWGLALPFLAAGVRRLNLLGRDDLSVKPLVGLLAAVVFVISCMPVPVPVAGSSSHPCGTAITAILVGPLVSVAVSAVALLLQALFLGHGGISSLGADIFSMGVVGSFAACAVFRLCRGAGIGLGAAAFAAGIAADWTTYLTTAVQLAAGLQGEGSFLPLAAKISLAFAPTQLPLGIVEGALTSGMVLLLRRRRPDLLVKMKLMPAAPQGGAP